jgi:hypothetical protein
MKKLITICLFMATTFTVNARNLNFSETVTYIKDNLEAKGRYAYDLHYTGSTSYSTVFLRNILISADGQIKCIWGERNIYPPIIFNLNKVLKIENQDTKIRFFITTNSYYLLETETQIDSERLTKAFNHLKLLLPKAKDPFGN